jgi:hypothetical protein
MLRNVFSRLMYVQYYAAQILWRNIGILEWSWGTVRRLGLPLGQLQASSIFQVLLSVFEIRLFKRVLASDLCSIRFAWKALGMQ